MSANIRVLGNAFEAGSPGTGSIDGVLPRVVNLELEHAFGHEAQLDPGQITLTPMGYRDRIRFEICSWAESTETNDPPGTQAHLFMTELMSDGSKGKLLEDKCLVLSDGKQVKLTPPEALFFLGINFRALSYCNEIERAKRR